MDLAEIRKKAKNGKGRTVASEAEAAGPEPSRVRAGATVQGVPQGAPGKTDPPEFATTASEETHPDPLEVLFNERPDIGLATEETYVQTLTDEQNRVEEDLVQWLTFSLGEEDYAIAIGNILEIIKPREITDIPRVPDFILGVISLRGKMIPIFDLKRRLKLGRVEETADSRIIVCRSRERSGGLLVDSLTQVVRLPRKAVEPPPATLSGIDRDLVEGVGREQGRMMTLLHLPSVLDAELA